MAKGKVFLLMQLKFLINREIILGGPDLIRQALQRKIWSSDLRQQRHILSPLLVLMKQATMPQKNKLCQNAENVMKPDSGRESTEVQGSERSYHDSAVFAETREGQPEGSCAGGGPGSARANTGAGSSSKLERTPRTVTGR